DLFDGGAPRDRHGGCAYRLARPSGGSVSGGGPARAHAGAADIPLTLTTDESRRLGLLVTEPDSAAGRMTVYAARRSTCARATAISRVWTGFLTISATPAPRARSVSIGPTYPLTSTIGKSARRRRSRAASSVPVRRGMTSSVIAASKRSGADSNAASAAPLSENPTGS